jgi:flagellar M-ring protein FliF
MDFLNKALAQLGDLFRSMTPGGRITAGLLLVVAVVSVGYLLQTQVTGGDEYLFSGASIPTATLQKMETAFGKAGLNDFHEEGGGIKVPHARRAAYLAALAEAKALPPNFGQAERDATDGNMWDPPSVRAKRMDIAKQEELTHVINCMRNIEQAWVELDSQSQPGGLGLQTLKTASVYARAVGGVSLDDEQVDTIRYCVAAAVAGMKPEDVTISDGNGGIHPGGEAAQRNGLDDAYARATRNYEQSLNGKIRKALSYIPNITIVSTVTLDREKASRSVEVKNDSKPVPIRTKEDTRSSNRESTSPAGAPGLAAQGGGAMAPASLGSSAGKGSTETSEESKNETLNALNTLSTEKEMAGHTPKSARVSIGIPASYYEKVWKQRNPVKDGEEAKKPDQAAVDKIKDEIAQDVKAHVANVLQTATDVKDPTSQVIVTTFQDIKPPEIQGPAATQRALIWFGQNWPMVAMVGLVLFSLNMLRSMLRGVSAPATESTATSARIAASELPAEDAEESVETTAARRLRRMTGSGPSLRDELSELVKEDPDSAANILRTWIGQVT